MNLDSCLRLLGVGSDATLKDVKRAYKQRIRACHPDRFQHDPVKAREAEEKTKRLNAAYHFLLQHFSYTRFNRSTGSSTGFAAGDDRGSQSRGWPFSRALRIFRKQWVPEFRFGDPNLYRMDLGDYAFALILGSATIASFIHLPLSLIDPATRPFVLLMYTLGGIAFVLLACGTLLPRVVLAIWGSASKRRSWR